MSCTHWRHHRITAYISTRCVDDLRIKGKFEQTNPQVSSAREVFPILVKGDGHDSVCGVEGLFHSITMVDVNVYV